MKYLQITYEDNPKNPKDGNAYVFYNPILDKVWIYLGMKAWILKSGAWDDDGVWYEDELWKNF